MLYVGGDFPILIINAKGEILNHFLKPNLALSIGKTTAFDVLGDSVLFQTGAFGNDLWSYNEKTGQTKSFKLVNNEKALSTEEECKLIKEKGIRYADNPDVFNISQLAVAGEQLVFGSKYQNHLYINIGNARTSSSVVYQLYPQSQIDDDITYTETYICLQYVYAVSSSDKHFFSFIQPSIIRESLEEKQRYRDEINYGKVKELIDNLPDPDNANPILIEFNFKS